MSKCTNPTQRQTSFFFNTRLYLIRQAFTTLFIHTQTYSGRMTGYRAVVFSESTQSNIILLLEKEKEKGNHGNDIFQAGESLDRHAFKAPFVCSRKMDAVFHCVQLHSGVCRQRRLEQASLPNTEESQIASAWFEMQHITHFAHPANMTVWCVCRQRH